MKSNFKGLLQELDALMKDARGSLFRRAQIIVALISDDDYWDYLKTQELEGVVKQLQRYIGDSKFTVDDLQVMLEFAPDESSWASATMSKLCDEAWAAKAAKNPDRVVKRKATPEVERLKSKIEALTAENKELRSENQRLKKRLESIEKVLA